MSVELVPSSQLGFHRPLTQLVKRTLTVANPNSQPVAFKVKTTAPKAFCVRPNSGRIEPGERVEVQVLLQPMKEEPAPGAKCRDKFLIQSAIITPDRETQGLADLWATVEAEHKSGQEGVIYEQKIRCAFLPPVDAETGSTPAGNDSSFVGGSGFTNGAGTPNPSRFDTVKSNQGTPYHAATDRSMTGTNGDGDATGPASTYSPPQQDLTSTTVAPSSPSPAGPSSSNAADGGYVASAQAAASNVAASLPKSTEEVRQVASNAATNISNAASNVAASAGLTSSSSANTRSLAPGSNTDDSSWVQKELQSAKTEVERLTKLLAKKEEESAAGLRQRNVGSSSADKDVGSRSQTMTATTTQNGIPIEIVAAIAAGVFLFTWLLF